MLAAAGHGLAAGAEDRVVGRRKGQLVDDDQRELVAGDVHAFPEAGRPHQHGGLRLTKARHQFMPGGFALHQHIDVVTGLGAQLLGNGAHGAQCRAQHEGAAAVAADQRPGLAGHPLGKVRRRGAAQSARDPQGRLLGIVEGAGHLHLPGFGHAHLAGEVCQAVVHGQGGRDEDPGAAQVLALLGKALGDRQRRGAQLGVVVGGLGPENQVVGGFGGFGRWRGREFGRDAGKDRSGRLPCPSA